MQLQGGIIFALIWVLTAIVVAQPLGTPLIPAEQTFVMRLCSINRPAAWVTNNYNCSAPDAACQFTWPGLGCTATANSAYITSLSFSAGAGGSGTLPDLSNMTNLNLLSYDSNGMQGNLVGLDKLTLLTRLQLFANSFTGTPSLSGLTAVTRLDLSSNKLTTMPGFAGMRSLVFIDISGGNQIADVIPTNIGQLTALTTFNANGNRFTGTFPASFNSLVHLQTLDLGGSQLTGPLPVLGGLTVLTFFNISGNNMGGLMPATFTTAPTIDAGTQRFCGCWPSNANPPFCSFSQSVFCCGDVNKSIPAIPLGCSSQSKPCLPCSSCTDAIGCSAQPSATSATSRVFSSTFFVPGAQPPTTTQLAPAASLALGAALAAVAALL